MGLFRPVVGQLYFTFIVCDFHVGKDSCYGLLSCGNVSVVWYVKISVSEFHTAALEDQCQNITRSDVIDVVTQMYSWKVTGCFVFDGWRQTFFFQGCFQIS
jgi:hypothetical protein